MPTAPGKAIRDVLAICEQAGIPAKTMPGMYELLGGQVSISQLRNVEIEDLLRREPVQTDIAAVQELLRGRCVLVTGGGGSIGSELCRQIMRCKPSKLVIVGHGENSVFQIHQELQRAGGAKIAHGRQRTDASRPDGDRARDRRHTLCRAPAQHLRAAPAPDCLPRRGAQACAVDGGKPRRGDHEQRPGNAQPARGRPGRRCGAFRADLHRQSGQSHQHHGRQQARRRAAGAPGRPAQRAALRRRALWQRARQPGQRRAHLQAANRGRRTGDGDRPGDDSAFS